MTEFQIHTPETVDAALKEDFERTERMLGYIPNVYGVMAESPELAQSYQFVQQRVMESSLTPIERNIVWLEISYQNNCTYCMAGHSALATGPGQNTPPDIVRALRDGAPLNDPKLEALRQFAGAVVNGRGVVDPTLTDTLKTHRYTNRTVLDVILAVSQKIMTNYVNHFAHTSIDDANADHEWIRPNH
ncbi:MAG: carboxymuconolactone decarboxylase family protein [Pseudomonadota bacterium]